MFTVDEPLPGDLAAELEHLAHASTFTYCDNSPLLETIAHLVAGCSAKVKHLHAWTDETRHEAALTVGRRKDGWWMQTVYGDRGEVQLRPPPDSKIAWQVHSHPRRTVREAEFLNTVLRKRGYSPWDEEWIYYPSARDYWTTRLHLTAAGAVITPGARMLVYAIKDEKMFYELLTYVYRKLHGPLTPETTSRDLFKSGVVLSYLYNVLQCCEDGCVCLIEDVPLANL